MHGEKIIIWGMSCSGKTTFAKLLSQTEGHQYYCFDALYPWHTIETLGLSIDAALTFVSASCTASKFVLDGWNLADIHGVHMPRGSSIYVVYNSYDYIIGQYRKKVRHFDEHRQMFARWYDIQIPNVRYFLNNGAFVETSAETFKLTIDRFL